MSIGEDDLETVATDGAPVGEVPARQGRLFGVRGRLYLFRDLGVATVWAKDGLITALGAHGFDLLRQGLEALPITDDPALDLIEAALMFRRFALEHPALFAISVQRKPPEAFTIGAQASLPSRDSSLHVRAAANAALDLLKQRVAWLAQAQSLGDRTVDEATLQFHALCEGLAAVELRGINPAHHWQRVWRQAFTALIAGFAIPAEVHHPTRTPA